MKTLIKYLLILFLITSCKGNFKNEKLHGIDLFKTKIKYIQIDNDITENEILENSYFISYTIKDYKKLQIHFSWKTNNIQLNTLNLSFGVENEYFRCVFDKTDFLDMKVNDTIILKTINLESSKFLSLKSNIEYTSDDFFNKILVSKKVVIFATIQDLSLLSKRRLSTFTRTSNIINITLQKK